MTVLWNRSWKYGSCKAPCLLHMPQYGGGGRSIHQLPHQRAQFSRNVPEIRAPMWSFNCLFDKSLIFYMKSYFIRSEGIYSCVFSISVLWFKKPFFLFWFHPEDCLAAVRTSVVQLSAEELGVSALKLQTHNRAPWRFPREQSERCATFPRRLQNQLCCSGSGVSWCQGGRGGGVGRRVGATTWRSPAPRYVSGRVSASKRAFKCHTRPRGLMK